MAYHTCNLTNFGPFFGEICQIFAPFIGPVLNVCPSLVQIVQKWPIKFYSCEKSTLIFGKNVSDVKWWNTTLKGPDWKLARFLLYLRIINTFLKNDKCIL